MNRILFIIALCSGVLFSACKSTTNELDEKLPQKVKAALSLQQQVSLKMATVANMADLGTVEYTVTKVVKSKDDDKWYKIGDRRVLFSCTAYIKAGIDMNKVDVSKIDINEENKSIVLTLPKAKVLSFNMPPEKCRLVYEKVGFFRSNFTSADRNTLLKLGEQQIRSSIPDMGILKEAETNAESFFRTMFTQLGFETITIKFA